MVTEGVLPPAVNLLYDIGCKLQAHWKVHMRFVCTYIIWNLVVILLFLYAGQCESFSTPS